MAKTTTPKCTKHTWGEVRWEKVTCTVCHRTITVKMRDHLNRIRSTATLVVAIRKENTMNLTPLEQTVLDACWQSALSSTGGDFAMADEVSVKGLGRKALGGVLTSLETKGAIQMEVVYVNGIERVVQIAFPDEFRAARGK